MYQINKKELERDLKTLLCIANEHNWKCPLSINKEDEIIIEGNIITNNQSLQTPFNEYKFLSLNDLFFEINDVNNPSSFISVLWLHYYNKPKHFYTPKEIRGLLLQRDNVIDRLDFLINLFNKIIKNYVHN